MLAIFEAPALAKARVVAAPIDPPARVMATTLPFVDSSGRPGSMAGFDCECNVLVRDGNGGMLRDFRTVVQH